MADHVIHISAAEAASDFGKLLERVRAGAEVVIENDKLPIGRVAQPKFLLLAPVSKLEGAPS